MTLNEWSGAFLVTQLVEVPIYLCLATMLRLPKRFIYGAGASTITHPIIWFCLPWASGPYVMLILIAEAFAVIVEALWGRWWGVRSPWRVSFLANASSFSAGLVLRWI